jgi:O-methyltransferase involved in polyketide biosynthesis
MVDYFRSHMSGEIPRCKLEFIAADLREADARRDVFARAAEHGPVLVITEGLLVYLEPENVAELARDLHDVAKARWWLSDLASPMLLKYLERQWQPLLKQGNAPFRFGPAESTGFFAPYGWRELEYRSHWDESLRLERTMPHMWLWKILRWLQPKKRRDAMKRFSGIILLEAN